MPSLDQQYNSWNKNTNLPTITNTNNNTPSSPNVPNYGYIPVKTVEYNQYVGPNGIVSLPNLWKNYA